MSFNPRTHTGCDYPIQKEHYSTIYVSIHAPTRGATAMGCKNPSGISVSIHAPTRGATRKEFESLTDKEFQSTHPHGVRPYRQLGRRVRGKVSIHAPTRGATGQKNARQKDI